MFLPLLSKNWYSTETEPFAFFIGPLNMAILNILRSLASLQV